MSYMATHTKLRRERGNASEYLCACGAQAEHWAYSNAAVDESVDSYGRRYSRDLAEYTAMCVPCHHHFDRVRPTHCPNGHEYSDDNVYHDDGRRKCRICVRERVNARRLANPLTEEQKAKKLQQQRARRRAAGSKPRNFKTGVLD